MKRQGGKTVLITGASSGIGRALAEEFIRREIPLIATARKVDSLRDLENPRTLLLPLDVTLDESIESAIDEARSWNNGIQMLINNAGWGLMGPLSEIAIDDFQRQMDTNLIGVLRLCQAVIPEMIARKKGLIVNIGSISGLTSTPFAGAYCASKAALHALSDSLRMELAPFGIRVITVQAGAVRSNFGLSASRENQPLPEKSPYFPLQEDISSRATASQISGISADDFSRRLIPKLLNPKAPSIIRMGPLSTKLPLLGKLPAPLRDRIFSRRFGLDRLGKPE